MSFRYFLIAAIAATLTACSPAQKPTAGGHTAIRFATDWRAEAEQGGFYEALANGSTPSAGST